jgi:DNA-binding PadR family transcriptional regulator
MNLLDIIKYLETDHKKYLNIPQATAYILHQLQENDLCGTELLVVINGSTVYALSDTVFYSAVQTLIDEKILTSYEQKVKGRGRPRKIFTIVSEMKIKSQEIAKYWELKYGNN